MGMGTVGLATVLPNRRRAEPSAALQAAAMANPMQARKPQFAAKAKRVIHIFSQGAPSHLDTWDHKPALAKHADQNVKAIGDAVARAIRIQENGSEWHARERGV